MTPLIFAFISNTLLKDLFCIRFFWFYERGFYASTTLHSSLDAISKAEQQIIPFCSNFTKSECFITFI